MTINSEINAIRSEIPPGITLVAVTKYATDDQTSEIIKTGITNLGESKIQALIDKKKQFPLPNLTWHFIGHLQTNKVKKAVHHADIIQSVDSLRLLTLINSESEKINKKLPVLLQINIANEQTKYGFKKEEIISNESIIFSFTSIKIIGIMLIAPNITDHNLLFKYFSEMHQLYNYLKKKYTDISILSMGMSQDYQTAIKAGANMIRIGSLILK